MNDTTNKVLGSILGFFIVLAFVLGWFVWMGETQEKALPGSRCETDVDKAQEASEGAMCTQEIGTLKCASDETYLYEARNGCIIGELLSYGWERVEEPQLP